MTQETEVTVEKIIIESGGLTPPNAFHIIVGWLNSACNPDRFKPKTLDEIRAIRYSNSDFDNGVKLMYLGRMQHQEALTLAIASLMEAQRQLELDEVDIPKDDSDDDDDSDDSDDDDDGDDGEPEYSSLTEYLLATIAEQPKRPVTAQYILYGTTKALGIAPDEIAKHAPKILGKPLKPLLDLSAKESWEKYEELRKKKAASAHQGSGKDHTGEGQ